MHLDTISLSLTHNQLETAMARPYAVVVNPLLDAEELYVISQVSGNQSMPLFAPQGPADLVLDLDNFPGFPLPDFDIMTVDAGSHAVLGHNSDIGTLLFGLAFHPTTGDLIVANMESKSGDFIGEGSFTDGKVVDNRLTFAAPGSTSPTYVSTEPPTTSEAIVMPTDIAIDSFGRVYVAGYASRNIGVFDASGSSLGVIPTGSGPRGLAFDAASGRLYCFNRADDSVFSFDVSNAGTIPGEALQKRKLPDPTYDRVRIGRKIFLDPTNSGAGTTGCFSCHPDLRKDALTWDLSKYFETSTEHTYSNLPTFKDRKGPMVTQDLRSLEDVPPYHWRGEQMDLEAFNGAFLDLLKGNKLGGAAFAMMKDYLFSSVYPPNPNQQLNRVFTPSADLGVINYMTLNSDGSEEAPQTCIDCHALPTGSDASMTDGIPVLPETPLTIKTAQLRGMWTKTFSRTNIDEVNPPNFDLASAGVTPVTGSGFFHSGIVDDLPEFIDVFFQGIEQDERDDIKSFMAEFDSGLAPATMYSEMLSIDTVGATQIPFLIDQANSSNCDLVAIGKLRLGEGWTRVSLLFDADPAAQEFIADDSTLGPFTWTQLEGLAGSGDAQILVLGVPFWSGERIALDRDRDGIYNRDELAFPDGPLSPVNPDTDGDGMWDGYDPQPLLNPNTIQKVGAPTPSTPQEIFATTNSLKLSFTTDELALVRIEYGLTTSYGTIVGDPFPAAGSLSDRPTNHWKTKHTGFLRLLQDGQPYHFRIHTLGQNGETAVTDDMVTTSFLQDRFDNARIVSMDLTGERSGALVTYTATVVVEDNQGNTITDATVSGRLTTYDGSDIGTQTVVQASTASGSAVIVFPPVLHAAGDNVVFDVPMTVDIAGEPTTGIVMDSEMFFAWPEGPSMVMDIAP